MCGWRARSCTGCTAWRRPPVLRVQRSIDLTEGSRLTIFLVTFAMTAAVVTLYCCVLSPMMAETFTAALEQRQASVNPLSPMQLLSHLLSMIVTIGVTVVLYALNAVIYAKLRGLRDQVDVGSPPR